MFMSKRENIVSFVSLDCFDQLPFGIFEMDFDPVTIEGILINGCVIEAEDCGMALPCSRLWPGHISVSSR